MYIIDIKQYFLNIDDVYVTYSMCMCICICIYMYMLINILFNLFEYVI